MFCGSYVWLRPPSRVWERVEVGSTGTDGPVSSGLNFPELGNNYTHTPPPSCSFLSVCPPLFFLSLALTLCLFNPSPGALHTPLFIYVSGDGNGLPPREEGWRGGELCTWMRGFVCVYVCTCRHTVYTVVQSELWYLKYLVYQLVGYYYEALFLWLHPSLSCMCKKMFMQMTSCCTILLVDNWRW